MKHPPPLPRAFVIGPEKTFLLFTASLAAMGVVWFWLAGRGAVGPVCAFKGCTGLPCFGCGGTRSMLRLLAGDWAGAWLANPGAFLAVLALGVAALYAAAVVAGLLRPWRPAPRVWRAGRGLLVLGLAANWLYLLMAGRV